MSTKTTVALLSCLTTCLLCAGCADNTSSLPDGFVVANEGKAKVIAVYSYTDEYVAVIEGVRTKQRRVALGRWWNDYIPIIGETVTVKRADYEQNHRRYKIDEPIKD